MYKNKIIFSSLVAMLLSQQLLHAKDENYKGVIELTQDITEIQKIEGERRLLDWA